MNSTGAFMIRMYRKAKPKMKFLPFTSAVLFSVSIAWSQEPPTCELDRSFFDVCDALWNSCGGKPSVDEECRRFAEYFFVRPVNEHAVWEPTACVPPGLPFQWLRTLTPEQRTCIIAGSKVYERANCVDSQCRRARAIRACRTGVGCNDPGPYIHSP